MVLDTLHTPIEAFFSILFGIIIWANDLRASWKSSLSLPLPPPQAWNDSNEPSNEIKQYSFQSNYTSTLG